MDSKRKGNFNRISVKLDYTLWSLRGMISDKEKEGHDIPKFVLQGEGSVHEYASYFEDWKTWVWAGELGISEEYLISVFIYGLRTEIKKLVQMMRPQTLSHAQIIAGLQEQYLESMEKKLENGLIPPSRDKNQSSFLLHNNNQFGQNLENKVASENEVLCICSSSKEMGTNNSSKEGQNYVQYELELVSEIVETGQNFQGKDEVIGSPADKGLQSVVCNKKTSEFSLSTGTIKPKEMGTNEQVVPEYPITQMTEMLQEIFKIQRLKLGHFVVVLIEELSPKQCIVEALRVVIQGFLLLVNRKEEPHSNCKTIMTTLVWFKGPDPGGTRLGPLFMTISLNFLLTNSLWTRNVFTGWVL